MNDDADFAVRFLDQLNMFEIRVLIRLPRLCHADIAYEIDVAKIIPEFCRTSYCLYDLMRLYSIVCHVQEHDVR